MAIFFLIRYDLLLLLEYHTEGLMKLLLLCIIVFLGRGSPCFKWNSAEISVEFQVLVHFLKSRIHDKLGLGSRFSNRLGYQMPCGPLVEFRETETHSRAHDDCHVSTSHGQGMTISASTYIS